MNDSGLDAEEKTQELIEAYQTLRNPEKRYVYDLSLRQFCCEKQTQNKIDYKAVSVFQN